MTRPKDKRAGDGGERTRPNPGSVLQDGGNGASKRDSSVETRRQGGWTQAAAGSLWISLCGLKAAGRGPGRQTPVEQVSPWQQWCSHQDALAVAAKTVPVIKKDKRWLADSRRNGNTRSQEGQDRGLLGIIWKTTMWALSLGCFGSSAFLPRGQAPHSHSNSWETECDGLGGWMPTLWPRRAGRLSDTPNAEHHGGGLTSQMNTRGRWWTHRTRGQCQAPAGAWGHCKPRARPLTLAHSSGGPAACGRVPVTNVHFAICTHRGILNPFYLHLEKQMDELLLVTPSAVNSFQHVPVWLLVIFYFLLCFLCSPRRSPRMPATWAHVGLRGWWGGGQG